MLEYLSQHKSARPQWPFRYWMHHLHHYTLTRMVLPISVQQRIQGLQNYKGNDADTGLLGSWLFAKHSCCQIHPAVNNNALWVLPPPSWAYQNTIGMTIWYIQFTVNRVLIIIFKWIRMESKKMVYWWLLSNPVYFRDGSFNWTAPGCTLEHWDGFLDMHYFFWFIEFL